MTTQPEILQERLRRRLDSRKLNRLLGDGGLSGRSGLVAPRMPARKAGGVRELPIAMPEPLMSGGRAIGIGEIISVEAQDFDVPAGGSLITWQSLLGDREGFDAVALPSTGIPTTSEGYYRATVALEWEDWFGGSLWVTVEEAPRFPPGVSPMWTAGPDSYARIFEGAGEVLALLGEELGVFVDHGDAAMHTLSRAFVQFSLVEATGAYQALDIERVWNVRRQGDSGHTWSDEPSGWSDPDAWWVWKYALGDDTGHVGGEAPDGTMDAFAIVDVTSATSVTIEATADNEFVLRLNGAEILSGDTWETRYTTTVVLEPGANRFDAFVTNTPGAESTSPAGWLFSMRRDSDDAVLLRSHEDSWALA